MSKFIRLVKCGNTMMVDSRDEAVLALCCPLLTYVTRESLTPAEQRRQKRKFEFTTLQAYQLDVRGRLVTSLGFYDKIKATLEGAGYKTKFEDFDPPDPKILTPDYDRLFAPQYNFHFRHAQLDTLAAIASRVTERLPGIIDCAPGFGKGFIIACAAIMFYRAKIHILTKRVAVARNRLLPELRGYLPDVGMTGGGLKDKNHRVQIITFDSLHRSDFNADLVFIDEVHEAAADRVSGMLARYRRSINFGFTATADMRSDGKDPRVTAICGPTIFHVPYQEAQENDMVVPIEIHWSSATGYDPTEGCADTRVEMMRNGIWTNDARNQVIAGDAGAYDPETQVLIVCETLEHAMHLKRLLPDFTLVYAVKGLSPEDRAYYVGARFIDPGEPEMTEERKQFLTKMFEKGKLKKVIATSVWNVGVSFNHLAVLIRADAQSSAIMDTQVPGRVSRIANGKDFAVVHDYLDQFNDTFNRRALKRMKNYLSNGWRQVLPPGIVVRGVNDTGRVLRPPSRAPRTRHKDDTDQQFLFPEGGEA